MLSSDACTSESRGRSALKAECMSLTRLDEGCCVRRCVCCRRFWRAGVSSLCSAIEETMLLLPPCIRLFAKVLLDWKGCGCMDWCCWWGFWPRNLSSSL